MRKSELLDALRKLQKLVEWDDSKATDKANGIKSDRAAIAQFNRIEERSIVREATINSVMEIVEELWPDKGLTRYPCIYELEAGTATGRVAFFCSERCRDRGQGDVGYKSYTNDSGNDWVPGTVCEHCDKPLEAE